jgi:hypothetical protein
MAQEERNAEAKERLQAVWFPDRATREEMKAFAAARGMSLSRFLVGAAREIMRSEGCSPEGAG